LFLTRPRPRYNFIFLIQQIDLLGGGDKRHFLRRFFHSHILFSFPDFIIKKNCDFFCRFYANGMCRSGESCPYGHDRSLSNRGTLPCKFFSTGTCAYGNKCRFSHGDPSKARVAVDSLADTMATLTVDSTTLQQYSAPETSFTASSWADAPEFVPKFLQPSTSSSLDQEPSSSSSSSARTFAKSKFSCVK
jgi:hypothetical protein